MLKEPMSWLLFILFLLGLSIGSFINAFEYRLHKRMDFIKARSHCPKCKHVLKAQDLMPLLSFVLIGGKCRYCGTKVSWQYPIIEFLSGMLFFASGCYVSSRMHIQGPFDIVVMLLSSCFVGLLLTLFLFFALYDVKHKIVPQKVIIPAIIFGVFYVLFVALGMHFKPHLDVFLVFEDVSLVWNFVAALIGGSFIALLIIITRGKGMGGGDLKLLVFMGLILGLKKLVIAFYIAIITGSILGISWGALKGKIRGLKLPFALFLSLGSIIAFLWGSDIYWWFIGIICYY
ncbi:prepilin peptidase [Candidatus Dojkabacteria bacterium]|nr:prepilin peptidase [Candidatus Dojkabacteria bacterium]